MLLIQDSWAGRRPANSASLTTQLLCRISKLYKQQMSMLFTKQYFVTIVAIEKEMSDSKVSMKLSIDTQGKRVLFAEAGKDCVDFLFHILSLPSESPRNGGLFAQSVQKLRNPQRNLHSSRPEKGHLSETDAAHLRFLGSASCPYCWSTSEEILPMQTMCRLCFWWPTHATTSLTRL